MRCICVIVARVGFLVLKLQQDLKSIQLMFWFFLVGFENITTIFPFL
jgi:hypothetical protein